MTIKISNKKIGTNYPAFIIAEGGINHDGKLRIAKKLISKAKDSGADAIKFQTFKADNLVSINSKYFKIFQKLELKYNDFAELSDFAKTEGIIFLSTPFSDEAVDFLHKLKIPAFKIASGDLTNLPLIRFVASKHKPIILSTGMGNIKEIQEAIKTIKSTKNNNIILLHSSSSYPTPPNEANLNAIKTLKNKFNFPIGYSDNGSNHLVPLIAISLGAKLIEKHFTLDRKMKGGDHSLSADPTQLKILINEIRNIETMLGDGIKNYQPSEKMGRINFRRSLIATQTIPKNEKITQKMISIKRPATGIEPKFMHQIIGKTTKRKILNDEPIKWKDLN